MQGYAIRDRSSRRRKHQVNRGVTSVNEVACQPHEGFDSFRHYFCYKVDVRRWDCHLRQSLLHWCHSVVSVVNVPHGIARK